MSARQPGRADESVGWPNLPCCAHRHKVSTPCPPSGVWLVLALCPRCDARKALYCRTHRDRHMPEPAAEVAPVLDMAEHRRRIGEVA